MNKSAIIKDVKIILDENEQVYGTLDIPGDIADPDQLQTDTIISRLIANAIDAVNQVAPLDLLSDITEDCGADVTWVDYDSYCSKATMPSGFLRLAYVKLTGWKRGATEFLEEDDELYSQFFADQAGVRPTKLYPGAAIVRSETAGRLDVVACPRGTGSGSRLSIISKAAESESGDYAIADKSYWAVIYMIAKLYYVTLGEKERASMMEAEVAQRLGLQATKDGNT